jgi:hypothetical protein
MQLGAFSFILQAYHAQQWVDNFVMHMRVSDVKLWWITSMTSISPLAAASKREHHKWRIGVWWPA